MNKRRVDDIIQLRLSRIKCRLLIVILSLNISVFLFNRNLVAYFDVGNLQIHSDTESYSEVPEESRF